MNNSVTAYASKGKTHLLISSLDTCASITGASQVCKVYMDSKLMLYLKSQKTGICYESGITVKKARTSLANTQKDWNPPGTKPEDMICIYFHTSYCTIRGNKDCCSSNCAMKSKTKKEREVEKKVTVSEAVEKEL